MSGTKWGLALQDALQRSNAPYRMHVYHRLGFDRVIKMLHFWVLKVKVIFNNCVITSVLHTHIA